MPPTQTFLSYSRADEGLVIPAERILCERGVRTWRDVRDLPAGPTPESLEEAIHSCNGFLIFASRNSASSSTIRDKELPEAARCTRTKPGFFLIPAFLLSPHEASGAFRGCIDVPLSTFAGVVIHMDSKADSFRALARLAFDRLYPTLPDPVQLEATSRYRPPTDIGLDLSGCLEPDGRRIRPDSFQRALRAGTDVHNRIAEQGIQRAEIKLKVHLSLAVALGLAFPATGAVRVSAVTVEPYRPERSDSIRAKVLVQEGAIAGLSIVTRISVSQDVSHAARTAMATREAQVRAVVDYSPATGIGPSSISSPETEESLAREIAADLKSKVRSFGVREIHLFLSSPVGFAFALGQHLSATANITAYDFDSTTTDCYPTGSSGGALEVRNGATE